MKLCNKCGKQLNDSSSFCDSCGNFNELHDLIFEYNGKKINLTNIIKMYDAKSAAKLISEELCIPKILSDKIVKSAVKGKIEYIDDSIVKKYKILNRFANVSKWVSLSFLALFTLSIIFGKNSKKPKKIESSSQSNVSTQNSKNSEQSKNSDSDKLPENSQEKSNSNMTLSQKNALKKAKSYLEFSGFSRSGLIKQLEFEKFSSADAIYAVDNCGANWNEQAIKKAKSYLDYSSFSAQGLIDQLKFEGFT